MPQVVDVVKALWVAAVAIAVGFATYVLVWWLCVKWQERRWRKR